MAKTGNKAQNMQKLRCVCGGEIKTYYLFEKRKLKLVAECQSCGKKARKPKELMK